MSLEVELKLLLPPADAPEVFAAIVSYCRETCPAVQQQAEKTLLNTYFDTADSWFRRHDSGLRTRQKQGQFEQTLKLAGQQHGAAHIRPEYNIPASGVIPVLSAFPAEVWPAGTDVNALQTQLFELFRTDFVRQTFNLFTTAGARIELAFDQGVVAGGGQQEHLCELELELQSGAVGEIFALAGALVRQFPLQLGVQSKAERGYLLAQQQPLCWQAFAPTDSSAAYLSKFLRNQLLVSRNLADPELLARQWLQWLNRLSANPAAVLLFNSAAALGTQPEPQALQSWLLQYSTWLLDPNTLTSTVLPA
ncbi:MAG: CYTH domain-containing protein [Rheinheimera sp.]|nr:CYTH domain-containing protein [Rheinheimera sp.]